MARKVRLVARTYGAAILERLREVTVPKPLQPHLKVFRTRCAGYEAACAVVDKTEAARDDALAVIQAADVLQDKSLDALGDRCVGAGIGTRQKPLGTLSALSISGIKALAYKKETEAVFALARKFAARKPAPPAEVKTALATTVGFAKQVDLALKALVAPQAAYHTAILARDALLLDWWKGLATFKTHAASAFVNEKATLATVFAPPDAIQAPRQPPAKKRAPKAPTASTAGTTASG